MQTKIYLISNPQRNTHGFALVVALSLMAFILLLLISLTTIVQVETKTSTLSQSQLKAELNSLLSLNIAMGELQRAMGPDQRISATAEILTTNDSDIPRGKRNIVGAWSSAPDGGDFDDPAYTNGELVAWLGSDARDANGIPVPNYNQIDSPAPDDLNAAVLVGPGSLADNNGIVIDDKDQVVIDLTNSNIVEGNSTTGRYGWWVGDEGVKARINLEKPTPGLSDQQKYRGLLEAGSFTASNPSALKDSNNSQSLSTIDFDQNAGRIGTLGDLELLPGGSNDLSDEFFHHLTIYSSGVISNVRDGGLKKDLSLAFEMDESLFDASDFAEGNDDSLSPWPNASFEVAPVFSFTSAEAPRAESAPTLSFTGSARGPVWNLLRDYYRIYQEIDDPLNDPTFTSQTMAPSLNHRNSKYNFYDSDFSPTDNLDQGNNHPALKMSGGRLNAGKNIQLIENSGPYPNGLSRPDDIVLNYAPYYASAAGKLNTMLIDGPAGDALRSDGSIIPLMVSANYMPIFLRSVIELGIFFEPRTVAPGQGFDGYEGPAYQALLAARSIHALHNPYNVKLETPDISYEVVGFSSRLALYDANTEMHAIAADPVTKIINDPSDPNKTITLEHSENHWDSRFKGNNTEDDRQGETSNFSARAAIEGLQGSNAIDPGEIRAYSGVNLNSNERSVVLPTFTPDWKGLNNNNLNNNTVGNLIRAGQDYTLIVRSNGGKRANAIEDNLTNGGDGPTDRVSRYIFSNVSVNHYVNDDGNQSFQSSGQIENWALAAGMNTKILGPGPLYERAIQLDQQSTSEFRYPMNDFSFYDPASLEAYKYGARFDLTDVSLQSLTASNILPIVSYDIKLKPTEYLAPAYIDDASKGHRYPVYTMTNPLAPVRDSKAIFPPSVLKGRGSPGFPSLSPGWDFNIGVGVSTGGLDYTKWGPSDGALNASGSGIDNAIMLELPTTPPLSIGKLQHANITVYDHMPALAIGNSFASPYIARDQTYSINNNRYGLDRLFYDISYLMNDTLWDGYFFSSYSLPFEGPQYSTTRGVRGSFEDAFVNSNSQPLPNPRMSLHLADEEDVSDVATKLFSGIDPSENSYQRSSENLMIDGAFNMNSTSVRAWQAVLAGAQQSNEIVYLNPTQGQSAQTASVQDGETPFLRFSQPGKDEHVSNTLDDENAWGGFRALDENQIEELANNIVAEIKARSTFEGRPFLSISEFVNRKLISPSDPNGAGFGLAGVLQAAINKSSTINSQFEDEFNDITQSVLSDTGYGGFPFPENMLREDGTEATAASTSPTVLLQADILQAVGSFLSARSDSFRIRSYGETLNPVTGEVEGKAWCEAIIQRLPEPTVPRSGTSPDEEAYWATTIGDSSNQPMPFGRRFKLVSIRWLSEEEV
ncbi:MAG: hypothetical protein AAF065_11390 [Verrucomicrobiota bacterium]